jgi:nucleotide-binding universal stress UspA family protein
MWKRILLLLDGSERAATALDYLRNLAVPLGAEVYSLQVGLSGNQSDLHKHQIYLNSLADSLQKELWETWQSSQGPLVHTDIIIGEQRKSSAGQLVAGQHYS